MRGIRGLKRCGCEDNLVWGLTGYAFPGWDTGEGPFELTTRAIRVRPKVTPYAATYGNTSAGSTPGWSVGPSYPMATIVQRLNGTVGGGWTSKSPVLCSRAVYEDDKQIAVNYLFGGDGHDTTTDIMLRSWHQVGLVESESGGMWNVGSFDPSGPANYQPAKFPHPYLIYRGSMEMFPAYENYYYKFPRPRAIYLGRRFFVFCGYPTSDYASTGGNGWVNCRFDNFNAAWGDPDASWYVPPEPIDAAFEEVRWYIMRPSFRCYLDSRAEQPDEPWVIAYDYASGKFGTGRWLDRNGMSLANRIEHVIVQNVEAAGMGRQPNVVCYQHMQGRDIAIFRGSYDVGAGARSRDYWIFDGSTLTKLQNERPNFITLDPWGNVLYGNSSFVRKTGPHGWIFQTNATSSAFPIPGSESFWEMLDIDPPIDWVPNTPKVPQTFREPSEAFQILCNKSWIQLRGFRGDLTLASGAVNYGDYVMANSTNSRYKQCGENANAPIPCWSISHDGQVRIPHIQPMSAYKGIQSYYTVPSTDTRRRMHARAYVDRDCSEWSLGPGVYETSAWPKWQDPFFSTLAGTPNFFEYLPQYPYHDVSQVELWVPPYQGTTRDAFISATNYLDFDIVDTCACACGITPTPY